MADVVKHDRLNWFGHLSVNVRIIGCQVVEKWS